MKIDRNGKINGNGFGKYFILFYAFVAFSTNLFANTKPVDSAENSQVSKPILHVKALKLRNSKGNISCVLFHESKANSFPKKKENAQKIQRVPVVEKNSECLFSDIEKGVYAIILIHDENSNKKMDYNFLGINKEGYGASQNKLNTFSPPNFKDNAFEFDGVNNLNLEIKLRY